MPRDTRGEVGDGTRSRAAVFRIFGHENEAVATRFGTSGFHRHFHDTFSFGLVRAGVNVFGYRRRTFEASAGTVGICDPGEVHDGGMGGIAWAYQSAFPSDRTMIAIAAELDLSGLPVFSTGHITDPLSVQRLDRFLKALFDDRARVSDEELEEAGIDAFGTIIARNADAARIRHRADLCPRIASAALDLIHDRWDEPIRLEEIAAATGASTFSTIRSVAKATGLTPHAYLIQLRVREAKRLMRCGTPIAIAAVEAGFSDQSHLSRALVQRWGVPPGAFKIAYARFR